MVLKNKKKKYGSKFVQTAAVLVSTLGTSATQLAPHAANMLSTVHADNNKSTQKAAPQAQNQQGNNQQNTSNKVTVESGDTLWSIAKANNTTAQDLADKNNINVNDVIHVGQVIGLQAGQDAATGVHNVQDGDTLNKIASANNITLAQLFQYNTQYNANNTTIYVGDKINVKPQQQAATPAPAATTTQAAQPAAQTQVASAPAQQAAPAASTPASTNAAKEWIAQRESSGNYNAQNGRYVGRYQLDASYLNGDYSPSNQERVADNYVAQRYGSWNAAQAFWQANGWY